MAIKTGQRLGVQPARAQSLQSKEQSKVNKGAAGKVSSSDAARIASQAGFQRAGGAKKKGMPEMGSSANAPIPLPDDEINPDVWGQETLSAAQGSLAMAGTQFSEVAKMAAGAEGGISMGAAVVGSSFMPVEEDIAEMEDLAQRKAPQPMPMMEEMSNSVARLFGVELSEDVPLGQKVLAAGLLVAGESSAVCIDPEKRSLQEGALAGGIEKVTKKCNQAVGEAQKMNKGVSLQLNLQRTMFRR